MEQSDNLALPYIAASQDQKHVTHNEAIKMLDALLHLSVISKETIPPATPEEGHRYLVANDAIDAWAGKVDQIAAFQAGFWVFYEAQQGWRVWVESEQQLYVRRATTWTAILDEIQNASFLGIKATADTTNRLALNSPASLFNHEGAGHQLKINKNQATDTGSLLYQTNWSGRAEMGLAGSDQFQIKVSADGSQWAQAFVTDPATGIVSLPKGINSGSAVIADDGFVSLDMTRASGLLMVWCSDDNAPDESGGRFAQFYFDISATAGAVPISLDASTTLETGEAPTGTSGLDDHLNIRVDTGNIHIENRRGVAHSYRWLVLS